MKRRLITEALDRVRAGQGQVRLLSGAGPEALAELVAGGLAQDASQTLLGGPEPWVIALELAWTPGILSPFDQLVGHLMAGLSLKQRLAVLAEAQLYHRHQILFHHLFAQGPAPDLDTVEDLLPEEVPLERLRLLEGFGALVRILADKRLLVVTVTGGARLSPETLRAFDDEPALNGWPLLFLIDMTGCRPGSPQQAALDRAASRGLVTRLEGPLPLESGRNDQGGAKPGPELLRRELWLQALHFDTVLAEARSAEPSLAEILARARAFEGREEPEEALLELQGPRAASRAQAISDQVRLDWLCARQYRALNDLDSARRLALKAYEGALEAEKPGDRARTGLLLLLLDLAPPGWEISAFEEDLLGLFADLGWHNHRAFVLGNSAVLLSRFRERGGAWALRRCRQALALSRRIKNPRRYGAALHALAKLYEVTGDFPRAERTFRRIPQTYGRAILPHELARSYNGYGFLLFLTGRVRAALQSHGRALELLRPGRHRVETLLTAMNVARVQLFAGLGAEARGLFETILVVLDALGLRDLPFNDRSTIEALLGLACLTSGDLTPALEIESRLAAEDQRRRRHPHDAAYRLWFQAYLKESLGDRPGARQSWQEVEALTRGAAEDLTYLRVRILADQARLRRQEGDPEASRFFEQALALVRDRDRRTRLRSLSPEARALEAEAEGRPVPRRALPHIELSASALLDSIEQDGRLREWRRTLRASGFLQAWQETLSAVPQTRDLLPRLASLIRRSFLVDEVLLVPRTQLPPGLLARYGPVAVWFEDAAAPEGRLKTATWHPFPGPGYEAPVCLVGSRQGRAHYGPEDHSTLTLALQHLETALWARQRTLDLEETLERLTRTQEQLVFSEKMAALGGLVAGVAHEINTPLGIALTGVTHAQDGAQNLREAFDRGELSRSQLKAFLDRSAETGAIVLSNLQRAVRLVQNFKEVAADQVSEGRRRFKLQAYLDEVLSSLAPQWRRTPHQVRLEGEAELEFESYPGALAQIITNLVLNALVHAFDETQPGTLILRVASLEPGWAEIRVVDNGRGIPEADRERIFEPFFTTRRDRGGTGLGLNIVFNLVHQALGGRITCESEPGRGTEFILQLPLRAPAKGSGPAVVS